MIKNLRPDIETFWSVFIISIFWNIFIFIMIDTLKLINEIKILLLLLLLLFRYITVIILAREVIIVNELILLMLIIRLKLVSRLFSVLVQFATSIVMVKVICQSIQWLAEVSSCLIHLLIDHNIPFYSLLSILLIKFEIFTISLTAWTLSEKFTIIGFDKLWWWYIDDFCLWVEGDFIFCALSSSDSYYCLLWLMLKMIYLDLMIMMMEIVILIMMAMNVMISVKTVAWNIILHLTTTAMEIMMTMSHALFIC